MSGSELKADLWINEYITAWNIYTHGVTKILAYQKTPYQEMYIESGPSFALFTKEYFVKLQRVLNPGGYVMVQAGPISPPEVQDHARLVNTLKAVFSHVTSLSAPTPYYVALGDLRCVAIAILILDQIQKQSISYCKIILAAAIVLLTVLPYWALCKPHSIFARQSPKKLPSTL